jgi:hypothetical protein
MSLTAEFAVDTTSDGRDAWAELRAGWWVLIRMHGVLTPEGGDHQHAVRFRANEAGGTITALSLTVSREQSLRVHITPAARQVLGPDPTELPADMQFEGHPHRDGDPEGSWFRVTVSRGFRVPRAVRDRFASSKDVKALDLVLGSTVHAALRDIGMVIAGQAVSQVYDAHPHIRGHGRSYWWGPNEADRSDIVTFTRSFDVVVRRPWDAAQSFDLVRRAASSAAARLDEDTLRATANAVHWMLSTADMERTSVERFLLFFLSLESLVKTAPRRTDHTPRSLLDRIDALIGEAGTPDADDLRAYLRRKRSALLSVSLAERFAELAKALSPDTATADIEAFETLADLRNALVHGRRTDVPEWWEHPRTGSSVPVTDAVRDLAFTYLRRRGDAAAALHPATMIPT